MKRSKVNPRVGISQGFTLVETVSVLILLGVLIGVAFRQMTQVEAGLIRGVDQLKSHLRYAQVRAQADIHPWRLVFIDDQTYQLGPVVTPGAGFTPSPIPGMNGTQGLLNDQVSAEGSVVLDFDSWGRPINQSGGILTADQTVTLAQGDQSMTITIVSGTGLIP